MNNWKLIEAKRIDNGRVVCKALVPYGVLSCFGWRMNINDKSVVDENSILTVQFSVQIDPDDAMYNSIIGDYQLLENPKFVELEYVDNWYVCTVPNNIIEDMFKAIR